MTLEVIANPFQATGNIARPPKEGRTATIYPEIIPIDSEDELVLEVADRGDSQFFPIKISDDEHNEDGSGDKEVKEQENTQHTSAPPLREDTRPLGFLSTKIRGFAQRKLEESLLNRKHYGPEWLIRPQHLPRPGRSPDTGYKGCWLDSYDPKSHPPDEQRGKDLDRLPRWFGPLNYSVIYANHDRSPRNSLEFFQLAFQPVEPGDMEVWRKYREIEETVWVKRWDSHQGFKSFIAGLHALAFGQKEEAEKKCEQMEKAIRRFEEELERTPWEGRDYYAFGTLQLVDEDRKTERRKSDIVGEHDGKPHGKRKQHSGEKRDISMKKSKKNRDSQRGFRGQKPASAKGAFIKTRGSTSVKITRVGGSMKSGG